MRMDCNSIEYQWFARAVTDFQMYNKYSLLVLDCTKKYNYTSYKNINVIMLRDYLAV
jgi:hypothetical protein